MHKKSTLREIPTKVEYSDEDEDDDMFASDNEQKLDIKHEKQNGLVK